MRNKWILFIVIALIIGLIAGFFGGYYYQSSKADSTSSAVRSGSPFSVADQAKENAWLQKGFENAFVEYVNQKGMLKQGETISINSNNSKDNFFSLANAQSASSKKCSEIERHIFDSLLDKNLTEKWKNNFTWGECEKLRLYGLIGNLTVSSSNYLDIDGGGKFKISFNGKRELIQYVRNNSTCDLARLIPWTQPFSHTFYIAPLVTGGYTVIQPPNGGELTPYCVIDNFKYYVEISNPNIDKTCPCIKSETTPTTTTPTTD